MRQIRVVMVGRWLSVLSIGVLALCALVWAWMVFGVWVALWNGEPGTGPYLGLVAWTFNLVLAARFRDRFACGRHWYELARRVVRADLFTRACNLVVEGRCARKESRRAHASLATLRAAEARTDQALEDLLKMETVM